MSLFATTTRSPTKSAQVGRQARGAADNFESPVLSNTFQEASVFLRRGTTTSSAAPVVMQLISRTRPRSASRGTSHWYSTVSLLVSSPIFPVAALTLSYRTLACFSSRAFSGFLRDVQGLQSDREGLPHSSRVFRENLERTWTRKSPRCSDARISITSSPRQLIGQAGLAEVWGSAYFGRQSFNLKCVSSLAGPLPRRHVHVNKR